MDHWKRAVSFLNFHRRHRIREPRLTARKSHCFLKWHKDISIVIGLCHSKYNPDSSRGDRITKPRSTSSAQMSQSIRNRTATATNNLETVAQRNFDATKCSMGPTTTGSFDQFPIAPPMIHL